MALRTFIKFSGFHLRCNTYWGSAGIKGTYFTGMIFRDPQPYIRIAARGHVVDFSIELLGSSPKS